MTNWDVFLVIVAVVGFIITIMTPILKLNTAITKLIDAVETLKKSFDSMLHSNSKSHERIWSSINEQDDKLEDHEVRIKLLEDKHKND